MSQENQFIEAAKNVERVKEELEQAYEKLNVIMAELGTDIYAQDQETKLVYKIVKPKGIFTYYRDLDYVRKAKEGERAGTLSKKEAEEKGFSLQMNEYILVSRKVPDNLYLTFLPKGSQKPERLSFFVQKKHFERFPKKGIPIQAYELSDFIFADGVLVKSRF
jgi:hypothetical protein